MWPVSAVGFHLRGQFVCANLFLASRCLQWRLLARPLRPLLHICEEFSEFSPKSRWMEGHQGSGSGHSAMTEKSTAAAGHENTSSGFPRPLGDHSATAPISHSASQSNGAYLGGTSPRPPSEGTPDPLAILRTLMVMKMMTAPPTKGKSTVELSLR